MVASQRARLAVFVFKFCLFLALFLCAYICFALMGNVLGVFRPVEVVAPLGVPGFSPTYSLSFIIDPGHGGEDAGALASDGTKEKDINLAIARHLGDFLHFSGTEVLFTRQEDVLLDYPDAPNKKSGDLMARVSVSKNSPHSVFVSLHMNKFPQERYHGLQVFYSDNHPPKPAFGTKHSRKRSFVSSAGQSQRAKMRVPSDLRSGPYSGAGSIDRMRIFVKSPGACFVEKRCLPPSYGVRVIPYLVAKQSVKQLGEYYGL